MIAVACLDCGGDVHTGGCTLATCTACGADCGVGGCSQHPNHVPRTYRVEPSHTYARIRELRDRLQPTGSERDCTRSIALLTLAEIVGRYLVALDCARKTVGDHRRSVKLAEAEDLLRRAVSP